MNLLKKSKVYLIGNLQEECDVEARSWRDKFRNLTSEMDIVCLSPLEKVFINFSLESPDIKHDMLRRIKNGELESVHRDMRAIRRRDLSLVDHSTFIVCVLNTLVGTYGTLEELTVAAKSSKPVFIVVKPDLTCIPLWLLGMFKPCCFYSSLEDVVEKLKKFDSGEKELNQKYWRIFEEEFA